MRAPHLPTLLGYALATLVFSTTTACTGCTPPAGNDAGVPLGDGFANVSSVDDGTVLLRFSRAVDALSVTPDAFGLTRFTVVPPEVVTVLSTTQETPTEITLDTGPLLPGETYTLAVDVLDTDGYAIAGTLNFVAGGVLETTPVTFFVSDLVAAATWASELTLLLSVDDETGMFAETLSAFPLVDAAVRLEATVTVAIDPARTISVIDDADPRIDRRAYAARVVDDVGRMVGPLVRFEVKGANTSELELPIVRAPEIVTEPEPDIFPGPPTDANPGDGQKVVRVVVDDRAASVLTNASVKTSFDANGAFDATFPQTLPLVPMTGEFDGFYEAIVTVAVDPQRVLTGDTLETFPYIAYLVVDGAEYEGLSALFIAPDETPETAAITLGKAGDTPVTFRIDVGASFVSSDGTVRGHYPNEAIFLTGEWQAAVDAFGNQCGDAFSGGEQPNLRMDEMAGKPGVWTKTIWLPKGRPYGWKVVRCDADDGCGPLNQLVSSGGGRAFATVMKNLVTDNVDAFADPNVGLVDPSALASVTAGGTVYDYTDATVYEGEGVGSEPDPSGTPDGARLFKQEAPDLVVVVGDVPLKTRVFVVGTWRDVNIGITPAEIIDTAAVVALTPFDYDDGFIGRYPPSREEP